MNLVLFHPCFLPPKDYGGTERVVLWLAKALAMRGHQVSVAAFEGSVLPEGCNLIPVEKKVYCASDFNRLFSKKVDLVHFMAPLDPKVWRELEFPALLTVHGNGKPGEVFPKNTVFLSKNHAFRHGGQAFVYNGIDPSEYSFNPSGKQDWLLFLSKTSWKVKNLQGAIHLCKKAKVPLHIAGGNRPYLERAKLAFSSRYRWEGPVHTLKKATLLSQARGLIFPVLWPEPFGLVVVEALISGTPVIASPRGSLFELVPSHVGALPSTEAEWITLLQKSNWEWDPEACRQWVLENFHMNQMAAKYEGFYQSVMAGRDLHDKNPISTDWRTQT